MQESLDRRVNYCTEILDKSSRILAINGRYLSIKQKLEVNAVIEAAKTELANLNVKFRMN